ncbi:MAG TPA: 4Fe-4S binding protein [Dehalococcoidales bacterium]|nr:4Fe-4S binding protein [Dehalococcoidales bacterium]
MVTDELVYRRLQQHLDDSPEGFHATRSGADIRILKRLFTPDEAQIAVHLSHMKPLSARSIQRRLQKSQIDFPLSQIRKALMNMVSKGTILAVWEGYREVHYQNAGVSAGGIYDFQVNRLSPELIADFDEYHMESFTRPSVPNVRRLLPLRTVPVEKSIPVPLKRAVSTYDDLRQIIQAAPGPLAVANCICRQTQDLKGHPCRYTALRESCLQIGTDHARQYVEMGIARYISKEEALEILARAQQDGLIIQPENSKKPEAICCCCGDCCALLTAISRSPRPALAYSTNYYVDVDLKKCDLCGTCVQRCQIKARLINDNKSSVDLDRCIGCGNCVTTCRTKATRLIQKKQTEVPPENKTDFYQHLLKVKKASVKD